MLVPIWETKAESSYLADSHEPGNSAATADSEESVEVDGGELGMRLLSGFVKIHSIALSTLPPVAKKIYILHQDISSSSVKQYNNCTIVDNVKSKDSKSDSYLSKHSELESR